MMLLLFKIVFFGVVGVSVLRFPRFGWFLGVGVDPPRSVGAA